MLRRLGAALLALCLTSPAMADAPARQPVRILLPAPSQLPAFAPWMIARQLGAYADAGYDVEFITAQGGADVAKQVGVGNAPIGVALGDSPIIVRPNGIPVKAVAVMGGGSLAVIVARGDRGIQSLADLRGKKLSVMAASARRTGRSMSRTPPPAPSPCRSPPTSPPWPRACWPPTA
jgi:NitT/TauT family transport system substrate-binding protein